MKNHVASKHLKVYVAILASIAIPFVLTLSKITLPLAEPTYTPELSPYAYTYSLLIFTVPLLMFFWWLHRNPQYKIERKAYYWCIFGVFAFGSFLDFVFGYSFFYFPNRDAVIGLRLPSFSFETWSWVSGYLPIEEFGFYLLGAAYMISLYLWGVLFWFRRYNHTDHGAKCMELRGIVDWNFSAVFWCVGLVIAGIIFKKWDPFPRDFPATLPFFACLPFCLVLWPTT